MKNTLILAALAVCAAIPAARAQTTTYYWTDTGSSFGNASGTITIDSTTLGIDGSIGGVFSSTGYNNSYDYNVTDMTGTFTSGTLAGASILGVVAGPVNQLNLSSSTPSTSLLGAQVAFNIPGYTISLNGGTDISPGTPYLFYEEGRPVNEDGANDTFTLSDSPASPVPESPLNPGLMAVAGLFIGWRSWRGCKTLKTETLIR